LTVFPATTASPRIPRATAPPLPPTSAAPAGNAFTLLVTGDLLAHTAVIDQARAYAAGEGYDFTPMLRRVQPIVAAADVAICHLETPVAPPGTAADGSYPDYGVPAQITAAIAAAGFDRCSLASNHAMDKGVAGVDSTLDAFDAAGLGHAGMARTPVEAGPTLFDVGGTTIAHLSYTFNFNGRRLPRDQPWRSNRIDPARIVAEARQARQEGARFVLVSLHWGDEGSSAVTPSQRRWAQEITASGAVDVIVGHHAHVVQPIEQVNGRWVVFGLGNFLTGMGRSSPCCGIRGQDGMIVRLRVTEQPDGSFAVAPPEAIATYVDRSSYVVLPVQLGLTDAASAGTVGPGALADSLGRTGSVVGGFLVPS
jgi:poly-gamma-glutamate synthesis protein (capsule biosynthesis protein)